MNTENRPNKSIKWILIPIAVLVLFAAVGLFIFNNKNKTAPQPILTTNFIDLSKVEKISKFRSCQGHTVVPQDESESRRNMKHYVVLKPEYAGTGKIEIYAPFDGIVTGIRGGSGMDLEGEIGLSTRGNEWGVSFLHLNISENLKEGKKVTAGDVIGHAADKGVDVVYSVGANEVKMIDRWESPYSALDSVFSHMSDEVLAIYEAKGVTETDMIYTKEYRDQNPCEYVSPDKDAQLNDFAHPEDWVNF